MKQVDLLMKIDALYAKCSHENVHCVQMRTLHAL